MKSALIEAIQRLCPDRAFSIIDDDPNQLTFSDGQSVPSTVTILAQRELVMSERSAVLYRTKRAAEYPSVGDQLDDLFKRGDFSDEMTARIKAIKDKYPKPS